MEVNKDIPFRTITTVRQLVDASMAPRQFVLVLMRVFGAVGLFLAAIGVFGIVNYLVTQRTQEIGLRIALGAALSAIVRAFIGEGVQLACIGVLVGLVSALGLTRLLSGLLFGVGTADPLAVAAATALVLGVAALLSYLPARRVAGVSPTIALRGDSVSESPALSRALRSFPAIVRGSAKRGRIASPIFLLPSLRDRGDRKRISAPEAPRASVKTRSGFSATPVIPGVFDLLG